MSESARLRVRQLMEAVTAGNAEALEGRGVNSSYRISDGGRLLSVKVHCPDRSSDLEFQRIRTVDTALRGAPWYPPVLDMGFHSAEHPQLVVIRPFMPGAPSDNAREHIDRLVAVIRDFTTSASGIELAGELVGDFASPWVSHGDRELSQLGPILVGPWEGLARTVDERLPALVGSAVRLTRSHVPVVYHGDLHGRNLIFDSQKPLTVIDWDEAGFSHRPADAGKALWLSCRHGRGDFVLDPVAVHRFLHRLHTHVHTPYASAGELAELGALWFLPRSSHLTLLERREAGLIPWYLGWISRFWSRFPQNLDLIAATAATLARDAAGHSRS